MEILNWFFYVTRKILLPLYLFYFILTALQPVENADLLEQTKCQTSTIKIVPSKCIYFVIYLLIYPPLSAVTFGFGRTCLPNEASASACWQKSRPVRLGRHSSVLPLGHEPFSLSGCSWEAEIRPSDVWLLPGRLPKQTGTRTLADRYSRLQANQELVWMPKLTNRQRRRKTQKV